jgi:hypothetical protein
VGLQGPFGYVQGEVLDIGLVRIHLRELEGEPPRPTARRGSSRRQDPIDPRVSQVFAIVGAAEKSRIS